VSRGSAPMRLSRRASLVGSRPATSPASCAVACTACPLRPCACSGGVGAVHRPYESDLPSREAISPAAYGTPYAPSIASFRAHAPARSPAEMDMLCTRHAWRGRGASRLTLHSSCSKQSLRAGIRGCQPTSRTDAAGAVRWSGLRGVPRATWARRKHGSAARGDDAQLRTNTRAHSFGRTDRNVRWATRQRSDWSRDATG